MKNFDFEAGKRLREEGDIAEALRCFQSALDVDRSAVETYIELALTYIMAFEESGDPLCLDSARKVCFSGLRREPSEGQRRRLFQIQDHVEDLLLESQKAEADAMTDAMEDGALPAKFTVEDETLLELEEDELLTDDPGEEQGH